MINGNVDREQFCSLISAFHEDNPPSCHPIFTIAMTVCSLLTMTQYFAELHHTPEQSIYILISFILLSGLFRYRTLCATLILLLSIVICIIPHLAFTMQFWNIWLALVLLGFRQHLLITSLALTMQTVFMLFAWHVWNMNGWSIQGIVTFNAISAAMVLCGYALAEHSKVDALRVESFQAYQFKLEAESARRNLTLASNIHDSTTQGLSLISLIAEQAKSEEPSAACMEHMDRIQQITSSTLSEVRKVIDILDGSNPDSPPSCDDSVALHVRTLRRLIRENDEWLSSCGIYGESFLEVDSHQRPSAAVIPFTDVRNLINQIYVNIINHGTHGRDSYLFQLTVSEDALFIKEFNKIGNSQQSLHVGKGLYFHKIKLESNGGSLITKIEDDQWILTATIPLRVISATCRSNETAKDNSQVEY